MLANSEKISRKMMGESDRERESERDRDTEMRQRRDRQRDSGRRETHSWSSSGTDVSMG